MVQEVFCHDHRSGIKDMCQLGCVDKIIIITVESIFCFLMVSVPTTQRRNDVEVLEIVCDVVSDASDLKITQKGIGRRWFTL